MFSPELSLPRRLNASTGARDCIRFRKSINIKPRVLFKGAMRKFTAALGILALAITLLPRGIAATPLDCCSGTMCPMHPAQNNDTSCGTDHNRPSATLEPCPVQGSAHYTAAIVFVLLAPTVLQNQAPTEPATAFLLNFASNAENRPEAPPPRLLQLA
jgi:hypothetical protein